MTTDKSDRIKALLERLDLRAHGWCVVDHWEADLCAVGVASREQPRRLVYISCFERNEGRYDYECEEPVGPAAEDYRTTAAGEDVTFDVLVDVLAQHLRSYSQD